MKKRVSLIILCLAMAVSLPAVDLNIGFHVLREEGGCRELAAVTIENKGTVQANNVTVLFRQSNSSIRAEVTTDKSTVKTEFWFLSKGYIYAGTTRIIAAQADENKVIESNDLIGKGLTLGNLAVGEKLMVCAFWEDPAGPFLAYLEKETVEGFEKLPDRNGKVYISYYDLVRMSFSCKNGAPIGEVQYWEIYSIDQKIGCTIPAFLAAYPNTYPPGRYIFTAVITTPDNRIYSPSFLVEVLSQ